jgi:hypothetical protein
MTRLENFPTFPTPLPSIGPTTVPQHTQPHPTLHLRKLTSLSFSTAALPAIFPLIGITSSHSALSILDLSLVLADLLLMLSAAARLS